MLLIDTGIFVAAADRNEPHHSECAALLRSRTDLAVTATVIPEAAWLIETRLGPAAERHNMTQIATLNHRDFAVVRPAHCDALDLVPSR